MMPRTATDGTDMPRSGGQALVVGASVAGLVTARVLTDFFERVTLLDRDDLSGGASPRKGVPQSRHPHALLSGGLQVLQELFPQLTDDLLGHGALLCDLQGDGRYYSGGRLMRRRASPLRAVAVSRPLLEERLRAAVLALPGVDLRAPVVLLDLVGHDGRVTGVRVRRDGTEEVLDGDLVVDATGRGSHTPAWLAEHGYPRPDESAVDVGISYVTWTFDRRPGDLTGARFLLTAPSADLPRFGAALAAEGDRWLVGCAGYRGDPAPLTPAALREFTATLPARELADLVASREPIEEVRSHRFPSSTRRHYEKLVRFPDGLVVIGDALSSFNPIYGQGMTVAALEAAALRDELAADETDLAPRFFRRAARLIDVAWDLAANGDLAIPVVPGPRPLRVRLLNWYVGQLALASAVDADVGLTFIRVANLLDPPSALVRPGIVGRVVGAAVRRGVQRVAPGRSAAG
jgi:2-polyprenyl-6-methoxyphenol hydroxylase-like FAD-dependent oxidoreductase